MAAILLFSAASSSCRKTALPPSGTDPSASVAVTVVRPVRAPIERRLRVTGTFFGARDVQIAAEVDGRVLAILKDLGDRAGSGEVLVRIDAESSVLVRDERKGALAQLLTNLGLDAMPDSDFDIESLPTVERAQLEARHARQRFERAKSFIADNPPVISEEAFEDAKIAADVAESSLRLARLNARTRLAEARTLATQVEQADKRIRDSEVRAPSIEKGVDGGSAAFDVARRHVDAGDYVRPGDPLFDLIASNPLLLRVRIPERYQSVVRIGQHAEVLSETAGAAAATDGVVTRIAPSIDPATRTFIVEIRVANPDGNRRAGSFAACIIAVGAEAAIIVPQSAVVNFAGIDKIFIVRDGVCVERRVVLGDTSGDQVEIRSGVDVDDHVIDRPGRGIAGGVAVVVQPAAPNTGAADAETR